MHLSPIKGGFPHKDQHDRTCPVAVTAGNKANLERGSVICVNTDGEFTIAVDTKVKPLYLALQPYSDLQATMAGYYTVGNGNPEGDGKALTPPPYKHRAAGLNRTQPAVSGIHLDDGDVWETDMFLGLENAKIGDPLTVKDGRFTAAGEGDDIVAYLRVVPYTRYANDAVVVPGMMTGAPIEVIQAEIAL